MEFTNNLNLPQYLVDWLTADNYDHDDDPYTISATTLMKPTRVHVLSERHGHQVSRDVTDLIASGLGDAVHNSIEVIETPGMLKEERAYRTIQVGSVTYRVSGKYDLLQVNDNDTYTLRDIKTTSVWAFIYGNKDEGYRQQLSIYRWILTQPEADTGVAPRNVNAVGFIDFFFTDWQGAKAKQDREYPQHRVAAGHRIELWSLDETEAWILARLEEIEANKLVADDDLPSCTSEELWRGDEKFAVSKPGAKRATKLCDSRKQAEEYIQLKQITANISHRPAKVKRCKYCAALPFCNQGQHYKSLDLIAP